MKADKLANTISIISAAIGLIIAILYYPIYAIGWIVHIASRIVLAVSYYMMLRFKLGNDIFKTLFVKDGRH